MAGAILVPLGLKWEIKIKTITIGTIIICLITGAIINIIIKLYGKLGLLQLFSLELFIILLLPGLAILFTFYRDPERISPNEKGIILSPADGRLIYIKKTEGGKVPYSQKKSKKFDLSDLTKSDTFKNTCYILGIGMNLLNVHVNRAPIKGKIIMIKHIKGKFFSLKKEGSILQNERVYMIIKNDECAIGIIQIASRMVRRIVSYLKEGELVEMGQRVGMIKFGSQVDILIPSIDNLEISAKVGDELKAGISILAKYRHHKDEF